MHSEKYTTRLCSKLKRENIKGKCKGNVGDMNIYFQVRTP
jgi:hypothetical protein